MRYIGYLFFLTLIFIVGCAEIGAPPGGPEDKTAPTIASSIPADGSVNISQENVITIFFSEKLVRDDNNKNIYISPRPKTDPTIKWKSDRVNIFFDEPFEENQTYIISFSSSLKDRRNNPMDSSAQIAFSTGDEIYAGNIAGYIKSIDGKNESGMMVGLFPGNLFNDDSTYIHIDSIYPRYLSQTNQNGYFTFKYLPPGEYSLIGFHDKNKDEKYTLSEEPFALSDRTVKLSDSELVNSIILTKNYEDSSKLAIEDIKYTSDKIIVIRFNKDTDLNKFATNPDLINIKSSSNELVSVKHILNQSVTNGSSLNLYAGNLSDTLYTVSIIDESGVEITSFDQFRPQIKEDKITPRILTIVPDTATPVFPEEFVIELTFSEAMDSSSISKSSFTMIDSDSALVDFEFLVNSPFDVQITPSNISDNKSYNLQIAEYDLKDLSSLKMGDSLKTIMFRIYNSDSLGQLSGSIENLLVEDENLTYYLTLRDIRNGKEFELSTTTDGFKGTFPAGKYIISGFIDLNNDGHFTPGSYYSKRLTEPLLPESDTVDVRARFETSGIKLKFE